MRSGRRVVPAYASSEGLFVTITCNKNHEVRQLRRAHKEQWAREGQLRRRRESSDSRRRIFGGSAPGRRNVDLAGHPANERRDTEGRMFCSRGARI